MNIIDNARKIEIMKIMKTDHIVLKRNVKLIKIDRYNG